MKFQKIEPRSVGGSEEVTVVSSALGSVCRKERDVLRRGGGSMGEPVMSSWLMECSRG